MLKLGVVFGGMSTEHDVSVLSGMSVLKNLDKEKYKIFALYIAENGDWFEYRGNNYDYEIGDKIPELYKIEDVIGYLKNMDCIFPVLHGLYGEDGTIQGLFELIKIPYVGCNVLSSSISMNKAYTKVIFEKAKLNQAKYIHIKKIDDKLIYIDKEFNQKECTENEIIDIVLKEINFPVFVKPANSGSSVGVTKAKNEKELIDAINNAGIFDKDILVEQGIVGKEIECAVLQVSNEELKTSTVGQILSAEEFYSYNAKYKNNKSITKIPADISKDIEKRIQEIAGKVFRAVDGRGLARVDFFVEDITNKIYINEINTLPGFTSISMYSKLLEADGIPYNKILDILINLAIN